MAGCYSPLWDLGHHSEQGASRMEFLACRLTATRGTEYMGIGLIARAGASVDYSGSGVNLKGRKDTAQHCYTIDVNITHSV
jgi:hypothetical protein